MYCAVERDLFANVNLIVEALTAGIWVTFLVLLDENILFRFMNLLNFIDVA